ncbi:unnamed protein product [Bursaphelenchus xylophilus]|uniref:(pine wood nematode) hypothetical protein n=1 Tax=Bursaphelenchus xylophilus TaxID=6326 RepID=A0A1I7SDE4_BURXY|nr:unnamed protein product [Bursaphelenchus xylophilus]CAG9130635.1 unnamed protein product [Bursaphelenchus xylophilus]
MLLGLFLLAILSHPTLASLCVVSKWRPWSSCFGDCKLALRVRNRDVLQPPLPEKDPKTEELIERTCPSLYETQRCVLPECQEESPFTRKEDQFVSGFERKSTNIQTQRSQCDDTEKEECCRVIRHLCPDGTKPKKVIRWYKQPTESLCRPYRYPYCGVATENRENPLISESRCIQTCAPPRDQVVLPEFRPL